MGTIESKTPIIVLSYHNCEIFCCHLDGYQSDVNGLLHRLGIIEAIVLSKPAHAKFRIWYNLDENKLDKQTMKRIAESISRFKEHIIKIAFIGRCGSKQRKFHRILKKCFYGKCVPTAYYTDAEQAKAWLV